jgi:hypothetical protein
MNGRAVNIEGCLSSSCTEMDRRTELRTFNLLATRVLGSWHRMRRQQEFVCYLLKLGRCGRGFQRNNIRPDYRKLIPWSRTFRDKLTASHLSVPHSVKPTGSLSCSQEPSTRPYANPDEFSPYFHTLKGRNRLKIQA